MKPVSFYKCRRCHEKGEAYEGQDHCPHCGWTEIDKEMRYAVENNGKHYESGSLEAIRVIESFKLGFNLGNAIKYILRADKKGDRNENLQKAINYLHREMTGKWPWDAPTKRQAP